MFLVGLIITLNATYAITSPMTKRYEGGWQVLTIGLTMVAVGVGLTALGAQQEQKRRENRQRQKERDRLYHIFLQLLKEGKGNVTVMQYAIATGLDAYAARAYLDEQAKALNAGYNVTQEGTFTYYFDLDGTDVEALTPLPGEWS